MFFPFPSGYRTLSKWEGHELTLAMSQYMDIDPGAPGESVLVSSGGMHVRFPPEL